MALRKTHAEDADASAGSAVLAVGFDVWGDMAVIVGPDCVLSVHSTCQECHWRVPAVAGLTCVDRESGTRWLIQEYRRNLALL